MQAVASYAMFISSEAEDHRRGLPFTSKEKIMRLCGFEVGLDKPFFLMAGPCVIESEQMILEIASEMKAVCASLGIPYIFKASYDKANRTSGKSYRGPGLEKGLQMLARVREEVGVPVVTDVHTAEDVPLVAKYVDVLQTPAFLCRQTDFIRACAQSGKPVNIKKGQFLAPHDMVNVIAKAREAAREAGLNEDAFMACERGVSFGYGNLVSDMRSLAIMRESHVPVVFDDSYKFSPNKAVVLKEGRDVSIFATGDILAEVIRAGEILTQKGIDAEIINIPVIKPLDGKTIIDSVNKTGLAVTVENHSVIGGLGSAVCECLSEAAPHKVVRIGVNDVFGQSGTPDELLKFYGLDAESIAKRIIEMNI